MTEPQLAYGAEQLAFYAQKYGLPELKMAEILIDLHDLKYFWSWVNAGEFLAEYLRTEKNKESETIIQK